MRFVDYVVEFDSWVPWEQDPLEQLRLMKGFQFGYVKCRRTIWNKYETPASGTAITEPNPNIANILCPAKASWGPVEGKTSIPGEFHHDDIKPHTASLRKTIELS